MTAFSIQPNDEVTFKVHFEDEHLAVVTKPPHVVTQPGLGHEGDSLLNGLFSRWGPRLQKLGQARDFGLLHRLDRETSGVLVVALSAKAYDGLRTSFESREVRKYYWAFVHGTPDPAQGVIRKPIAESAGRTLDTPAPVRRSGKPGPKKLARISSGGKPAVTAYRTLSTGPLGSLVECRPVTGRLHQVRVHLESIGCPILGDGLYAPRGVAAGSGRLALHSHRIVFTHPITGETVDCDSGWPADLKRLLNRLRLQRPEPAPSRPPPGSS